MATGPTELETAELNEKYETHCREIATLKRQIHDKRKRLHHNRVLRSEYDKRIISEKKQSKTKSESPQNTNSESSDIKDDNTENINKKPAELHKLTLNELNQYKKLSGHGNKVYGVDWNPVNPERLVSVGRDGKLIFWNADTGYKRLAYPLDTEFIMTLAYSPNGRHVACGGLDDILSIFAVREQESGICKDIEPQIFKSHTGYISDIQYIDAQVCLTSSGDGTIREWDIEHYQKDGGNSPLYTYRVHREDVMSLSLNPRNRQLLLSGSVDSTAKIIDLRIKPQLTESKESNCGYNGDTNVTHSFYMGYDDLSKKNRTTDVNVVRWFPEGNAFVAGCDDGTVRLFDTRSNRILNEYSYHRNYLHESNSNGHGGTESNNNSTVLTDTNTPIIGHKDAEQQNAQMNERKTNEPLRASDEDNDSIEDDFEPTDGVATLDFSNSGAFMFVSYNNDKHKVLAWNMLTGDVVQELKHDDHVPSLVVSPDGTKLVTACWDHHLKLWS